MHNAMLCSNNAMQLQLACRAYSAASTAPRTQTPAFSAAILHHTLLRQHCSNNAMHNSDHNAIQIAIFMAMLCTMHCYAAARAYGAATANGAYQMHTRQHRIHTRNATMSRSSYDLKNTLVAWRVNAFLSCSTAAAAAAAAAAVQVWSCCSDLELPPSAVLKLRDVVLLLLLLPPPPLLLLLPPLLLLLLFRS
jgi:hypothetical protein